MGKIQGYTLLELVITLIIFSIIIAASTQALLQGLSTYTSSQEMSGLEDQANYALERMTRIVRSVPVSSFITTATSSQFSFKDPNNNTYSYSLSSGSLLENSNTLAANVSTFTLAYYDRNGNSTTVINAIRFVKMVLTLTKSNYSTTYTTSINLPNLL